MKAKFFDNDTYLIDEKVQFLKFRNEYKVYDTEGTQIGMVMETVPGIQKVLRLLVNKAMLPFELQIQSTEGLVLASLKRGFTLWMSKIQISDEHGQVVGYLKQKFKFLKPTFIILDKDNQELGQITGDWKAWNFTIKNNKGEEIGTINKKWSGVGKELFTSADKYAVNLTDKNLDQKSRMSILTAAITVDMVLKESN